MMTPADFDTWWHDFTVREGRSPCWDELILAVQADALGLPDPAPMTLEERVAAGIVNNEALATWEAPTR